MAFGTTGVDGLEDVSLVQDVFNAWKPKPKAGSCVVGWTLSIHLLIHWVLHDSSFPASRDIAASIQTPIQFSSQRILGALHQGVKCAMKMFRGLYQCFMHFHGISHFKRVRFYQ